MTWLEHGYELIDGGRPPSDPWSYIAELVGQRPEMVEVQPIRPVEHGRSFASTRGFTPLHTDSQDYRGAAPRLQVMICRQAAARGGETILLDTRPLVAHLAKADPALHRALFTVTRTHRFYFGDLVGPTIATRRGHQVFTHAPQPPIDPVGEALAAHLASAPLIGVPVATGQVLLVDNHRMLHGRTAFADGTRHFVRLLAWFTATPTVEDHRLAVVCELLAGTPPAKLAARERISEAELYAWRTQALSAALGALRPSS